MLALLCDWSHEGERCKSEAAFLCSHAHIICKVHSIDARSKTRRRTTDRMCGICGTIGVIKIFEKAHAVERRQSAQHHHRRSAASDELTVRS